MRAIHWKAARKTAYKKLQGVKLPKKKQMLVRAICLNYADRPKWEQDKIQRLCDECAGEYSAALFELMTTEKSIQQLCNVHHVSPSRMYDFRRKFNEKWFKKKK